MPDSTKDLLFDNYARHKQTFIIPLTFTDIKFAKDIITRIGYGGDIWEIRVDLLSPKSGPLEDVNVPPLEYVREQVKALQQMSPLPILYTIRTKSQGGKFPNDAAKEALDLMLLAVESGIGYIDVEIEWPELLINTITEKKQTSKIVASYHSWTGLIRWTSQELKERFVAANKFGDIIKLSILSKSIEDTYELGLFVRDYNNVYTKPLLAVGMGGIGQLSRITSPISLVTHPLIPFPSAPGQLSLAQVNQAQHLMGLLPAKEFSVAGEGAKAENIAKAFQAAFVELGFPFTCKVVNPASQDAFTAEADGIESITSQFTTWTGRPAPLSVIQNILN